MNIFFCYRLNNFSGWGTLSIHYIKKFKKNNIIVFCNKSNPQFKYKQYSILRNPISYLKNPFFIFIDTYKIIKIIKEIKKKNKQNLNAHILVEPYALLLLFANFFFKKKFFIALEPIQIFL